MLLVGKASEIRTAINQFKKSYHDDYYKVLENRLRYLNDNAIGSSTISRLAVDLRQVLINWGADYRKAPKPSDVKVFESALNDKELRNDLLFFSNQNSYQLSESSLIKIHGDVDALLINVLNRLADKLFINNTNVTYPMKAFMLLTAYMPAYDSNVRKGLTRGGYSGFATTRFLLPKNTMCSNSKKITRMPYILGCCWNNFKDTFIEGVGRSNYPSLVKEPARVFDILLFMQSQEWRPLLLQYGYKNNATGMIYK